MLLILKILFFDVADDERDDFNVPVLSNEFKLPTVFGIQQVILGVKKHCLRSVFTSGL